MHMYSRVLRAPAQQAIWVLKAPRSAVIAGTWPAQLGGTTLLTRLEPPQRMISQSSSRWVLGELRLAKGILNSSSSGKRNYCSLLTYLQDALTLRWGSLLPETKTWQEGVRCWEECCLWDWEWKKATSYIQNLKQLSCIPFPTRLNFAS